MKKLIGAYFMLVIACLFTLTLPAYATDLALPGNIQSILDKGAVWIGLIVLIWEYLLSKTDIVKSNSTIDLVLAGLKKLFGIK